MIIEYRDGYFLILSQHFSRDIFLKNARVKTGTYAFDLINRIYDILFSEIVDIRHEYETYYLPEFENIFVFLEKKYYVDGDTLGIIKGFYVEGKFLFHGKKNSTFEYNLEDQIVFSEKMSGVLNRLLEVCSDENKNRLCDQ